VKFVVLVLAYDGTIAIDGVVDRSVREAIAVARDAGIVVLLATARTLSDLRRELGGLRYFDAVVAENGAVLTFPGAGHSRVLAPPPDDGFVEALRRHRIDVTMGQCLVEAPPAAAQEVLAIIRQRRLSLVPVFDGDRLLVLPDGISKATGLRQAFDDLRVSAHNAIAIGDAENDVRMLELCERGVAVSWGSDSLKAAADDVIDGTGPEAVAAYIERLVSSPAVPASPLARRRALLGHTAGGDEIGVPLGGGNLLVAGDPKSGKSWVTGLLCEQLALQKYCVCVLDPEGDYTGLEQLPGVIVLGGDDPPPRPHELLRALRYPDLSVVIDLSRLTHTDKADYLESALPALALVRRRAGVPHRIVVDEAHYFLNGPGAVKLLDLELGGYVLATYQTALLDPAVVRAADTIIVTLASDRREVHTLAAASGLEEPEEAWVSTLGQLDLGEAVVLPGRNARDHALRRFTLVPRLTPHVRHREKYLDVPVPARQAFVFDALGIAAPAARTLREFIDVVTSVPSEALDGHLRRRDFSRWIGDVFGDYHLASRVRDLEGQYLVGWSADINDALARAVRERYDFPDVRSLDNPWCLFRSGKSS
jgi:hydroxymethylpyrimidine pyrophosphatase-like HAD family hydrolase